MSELIKKNRTKTLNNRYSFAVTDEMKAKLDELKKIKGFDVNEMLRRYSTELLNKAEKLTA